MTTPPNAPEKVIADPATKTGEGVLDLMYRVQKRLERDSYFDWARVQSYAFDAVAELLTREAALGAEVDLLRRVQASMATEGVALVAERDALAAEVVALRKNAAAERNRGIMDAEGLLQEVSSKHRSAAATAYAQELLNALMQKYAETQAAARAPATIGGDAT